MSQDERQQLHHINKNYLIVGDTLYCHGVDSILRRCFNHKEVEAVLNDSMEGCVVVINPDFPQCKIF